MYIPEVATVKKEKFQWKQTALQKCVLKTISINKMIAVLDTKTNTLFLTAKVINSNWNPKIGATGQF